jgi:uncharacterized membrane protein YhfC
MDSMLDIFGLTLGMIYTVFAPVFAYFLMRTFAPLRVRDIALGVFGFVVIVVLGRTPVSYVAFALAARLLAEGHSPSEFATTFLYGFCFYSAFGLLNEAACFLLLKYFASRREGPGPGFAYAIGAGGAYCLMLANNELHYLRFAMAANGQNSLTHIFAYGIPQGAGAVYRILMEIVLASLVWRGIVERRWGLIGAAVLLDVGLAATFSFFLALMPLTRYVTYESLFGLIVALSYFWAPPVLRLRARFMGLREGEPVIEDTGTVRAGLLSTWRAQRRRDGQD